MRKLHYDIYEGGNVGLSNVLISIEAALLIGYLHRRRVVFYCPHPIAGSDKTIFDLFDIDADYEIRQSNGYSDDDKEYRKDANILPCSLMNAALYEGSIEQSFYGLRTPVCFNPCWYGPTEIQTCDSNNLIYYSHLFSFGSELVRRNAIDWLRKSVRPKKTYIDIANQVAPTIPFTSLHIRRGDFKDWSGVSNLLPSLDDIDRKINQIHHHAPGGVLLHTDETDPAFLSHFVNLGCHLPDVALNRFALSKTEKGLVSMLIAAQSENFAGTFCSTFTGLIQRWRLWNGKSAVSETGAFDYVLPEGYSLPTGSGQYGWNRCPVASPQWMREWPECV